METKIIRYRHTEIDHNLGDPSILVPLFYEMFKPESVCDVGCGVGNFLYVFKQQGVKKVLGVDGTWVTKELLSKHLTSNEFIVYDFENSIDLQLPSFDLCICLEVAEHISEDKANAFIDFLTSISDTIIFSAALPFQGGTNHINEQKEDYWEAKFNRKGYKKYDIIRHLIFSNGKISNHYRRNIVVYSKKDLGRFKEIAFSHLSIQENCQERLYQDLMANTFEFGKFSKFYFKILFLKLSGKTITRTVKRMLGKRA